MLRLAIAGLLVLSGLFGAGAAMVAGASPAAAATALGTAIDVVEVTGLIDPVEYDWMQTALSKAQTDGSVAIIYQIDSKGVTVSNAKLAKLAAAVVASKVPVVFWVGPGDARALGGAAQLISYGDAVGLAAGARMGKTGPSFLDGSLPPAFGSMTEKLKTQTIGQGDSLGDAKVEKLNAPILGELYVGLNGKTYRGVTLSTSTGTPGNNKPTVSPRFSKPALWNRLFHTVASAPVAYLLFLTGLTLMLFEFVSAGIGISAGVGIICVALASYGFGVLPVRPYGVAFLVAAILAFAIDVQAGAPRFWTSVGTVLLVVGSFRLFDGGQSLSWIALVVGIGGVLLAMITGMPSIQRVRFATPTIGREWMVGLMGKAVTAVDPEGTVEVRGAPWRARTNRATPLAPGDPMRVVAIDGLILEVEPESGGAQDHRERAKARKS